MKQIAQEKSVINETGKQDNSCGSFKIDLPKPSKKK